MSEPEYTGTATDFYLAAPDAAESVNIAVHLNRPILVEGEPGCGKTMLAYSIAREKGLPDPVKVSVKSTSRAQGLLYSVNHLRRLQDAQDPRNQRAPYVYPYLSLGPLGEAIRQGQRSVVLIDEIDKADIDFPNDLLDVLEGFSFQIPELPGREEEECVRARGFGRRVSAAPGTAPIVVITSNREKRLPEPFLRRCIYVRLRFPETAEELCEIVRKNTRLTPSELNQQVLEAAVETFRRIRARASGSAQKPPSTSELIDWVRILHWRKEPAERLRDNYLPPFWQMLFKNVTDMDSHLASVRGDPGR